MDAHTGVFEPEAGTTYQQNGRPFRFDLEQMRPRRFELLALRERDGVVQHLG